MSERVAGRYLLLRPLGHGGMGTVHLALDLTTGAECALKRLRSDLPLAAADVMRSEFEVLARVRHPLVVGVHELGRDLDGAPFYTMDYVAGVPADQALLRGDWPALLSVASQLALALEVLHASGVCHGDLKPANVLVIPARSGGSGPQVRLVDFGLAQLLDAADIHHRGTAGFAAPELAQGAALDVSSDLYGLGSTLYALIAGAPPFTGATVSSILKRQRQGSPAVDPLTNAGAPEALVQLVLQLLATEPAARPASARDARRALERMDPAARRSLDERIRHVTLTGRARELARVEQWWATPGTTPRVVVVCGPAGSGKSALLDELSARAGVSGRGVALLSCTTGTGPGQIALALMRRFEIEGAGPQASVGDSPNAAAAAASRTGGESLRHDDGAMQARIEDSVRWARRAVDRGRLSIVLLDDAESLDDASREYVRRMLEHPAAPPLLWILARRGGEQAGPPDEEVLVMSGRAERLALRPIDRPALELLLARRLGGSPPAALVVHIWSQGGAVPGAAVELLRRAIAHGALRDGDVDLECDAARLAMLDAPFDFEVALVARLDALDEATRLAAHALAVWRQPVTPDRVRAIEPRADHAALEALLHEGMAQCDSDGAWSLLPPSLAPRIDAALPPGRRADLHRRALTTGPLGGHERFEHFRAAGDTAAAIGEAAATLDRAFDPALAMEAAALCAEQAPDQAAQWYTQVAETLMDRGRHADAVDPLRRALSIDTNPVPGAHRRERLALALARIGRHIESQAVIDQALAGQPALAVRARLGITQTMIHVMTLGSTPALWAQLEATLALARASGDTPALAGALFNHYGPLALAGRLDEAESRTTEALEAFRRAEHVVGECRALSALASIAMFRGDLERAERLLREGLDLSRARGARVATGELLIWLGILLTETGRWSAAREAQFEMQRLLIEDGRADGLATGLANMAMLDALMGRLRDAVRRARLARRAARRHERTAEPFAHAAAAAAARASGRVVRARRFSQRAALHADRRGPRAGDWIQIEIGRQRSALGQWADAARIWGSGLASDAGIESIGHAFRVVLSGRATLRAGDLTGAGESLRRVRAWQNLPHSPYARAMADVLESEIALSTGDASSALEPARRALEGFARLPAPPDQAEAALELARVAIAAGKAAHVPLSEWLDTAAAQFATLGDHRRRAQALAMRFEWARATALDTPDPARDLTLLSAVGGLLHSLSDFNGLTQRAMQLAVEQMGAERGVLLLTEEPSGRLVPHAEIGAVDAETRREAVNYSRQVVRRVAESGGSILIADAPTDPAVRSESVLNLRLRSIVCVPLHVGGRLMGAVYLDDSRRAGAFSETDRGLLEGFAQLMAIAIEKSRGHEEARRTNDMLVGENLSLRQEAGTRYRPHNLIGSSMAMQRVLSVVESAARVNSTVLISGENGTGKDLMARTIHHMGKRRHRPFIAVNCAAIPETLFESELFGHVPGAFSGAIQVREGRFQSANGGTLFLDEIGEMPMAQQVKLLRAIANREITPVGGDRSVPIDVRIIAATNKDLRTMVERNTFRIDLFYRLNIIEIEMPPLRERKADIPAIAMHFLGQFSKLQEREMPRLSPEFLACIMQSDWPGNVRELQNYIERVLATNPDPVLQPRPLPRDLEARGRMTSSGDARQLPDRVAELEKRLILEALDMSGGNQSGAARSLGLTEQALRYKMKKFSVGRPRRNVRARTIRRLGD